MLKELKKMLKRFNSDNRGDTLAVVIIGIFVVGMLGTIILAMTANNYRMRVVDRRSQTTFYQNEKVVDEIKGVIGTIVFIGINAAFTPRQFFDFLDSILTFEYDNMFDEFNVIYKIIYVITLVILQWSIIYIINKFSENHLQMILMMVFLSYFWLVGMI